MLKITSTLLLIFLLSCDKTASIYTPDFCGKDSIAFYGDSQLADGWYLTSIPEYYERMTGCAVYHGGIGGQSSVEVADRYAARTTFLNCPLVIWAGRNNSWSFEQIKADYRRMIGNNPDYLIILVVNGAWPTEVAGTEWNEYNDKFNAEVIKEFGITHCLNPKDLNIGLFDSEAEEKDVVSARYRADELHQNSLGNFELTKLILAKVRKCQTIAN